jgi:hypothetical protein
MKKQLFIFFILFSIQFGNSQVDLAQRELLLNTKLEALRAASNDDEIETLNIAFKNEMLSFLKLEGAFSYPITKLKTIALLDSPDKLVRIINWNLEYSDMSYSYCGFVMRWDESNEEVKITELIDKLDPYTVKPTGIIDAKNWYGALYYKILPIEYNGKTDYTLLGWDGGTSESNFKIIDVLTFSGNNVKLGSPVFIKKKEVLKRVVFEYSDKSSMSLKYEDKYDRIVFDHLSPESPSLAGVYSFYVPDFSYDAYIWDNESWVLNEDVITINNEEEKKNQTNYVLDEKTGKIKEKKVKNGWLNPADPNKKNDIGHVARVPEINTINEDDNSAKPKRKSFWRDRRDPNNLSITTGKNKKKKRRKNKP